MTSPSVGSACSSCWGTQALTLGSFAPTCCDQAVRHLLMVLALCADSCINPWHVLLPSLWWLLLWQRAWMPIDYNWFGTHLLVGQSLAFIQWNDSVSVMDQLVALLNEKCLVRYLFFHALKILEHCIPIHGSDQLNCYTCSLGLKWSIVKQWP